MASLAISIPVFDQFMIQLTNTGLLGKLQTASLAGAIIAIGAIISELSLQFAGPAFTLGWSLSGTFIYGTALANALNTQLTYSVAITFVIMFYALIFSIHGCWRAFDRYVRDLHYRTSCDITATCKLHYTSLCKDMSWLRNYMTDPQAPTGLDRNLPHKVYLNKICRSANLNVYATALALRTSALPLTAQNEIFVLAVAIYDELDKTPDPIRKNLVELCEAILAVYRRVDDTTAADETNTSHVMWRAVRHAISSRELPVAKEAIVTFVKNFCAAPGVDFALPVSMMANREVVKANIVTLASDLAELRRELGIASQVHVNTEQEEIDDGDDQDEEEDNATTENALCGEKECTGCTGA